jgi:hypothetical protein
MPDQGDRQRFSRSSRSGPPRPAVRNPVFEASRERSSGMSPLTHREFLFCGECRASLKASSGPTHPVGITDSDTRVA